MNQELLYKYFKGITSVEEEKMILDWIDASDENRDIFLKERIDRKSTRLNSSHRHTSRMPSSA